MWKRCGIWCRVQVKTHGSSTHLVRVCLAYISSPEGAAESRSISKGFGRMSLSSLPTQSEFYSWFTPGLEYRKGFESNADRPLASHTISYLFGLIMEDRTEDGVWNALCKVGAAIAVGVAGSLRGNGIVYMDLAGTRELLDRGKEGVMPLRPFAKGTDLMRAPYVHITLQGKFKGENHVKHHLIAVASETRSGIQTR